MLVRQGTYRKREGLAKKMLPVMYGLSHSIRMYVGILSTPVFSLDFIPGPS